MKINLRKIIISIVALALVLVLGETLYFYSKSLSTGKEIKKQKLTHSPCLNDNEIAIHEIDKGIARGLAKISIRDRRTNEEIFSFQIENTSKAGHSIEKFKCNIYVIRVFKYDDERGVPLPDYRTEIWRFSYNGNGEKILDLFKKEGAPDNYGQDFRIDPSETYIALERSYLGNPNYALVIKDLKTSEDIFILPLKEITNKYPKLEGSIGFNEWTKDGRYFWGNISYGANVLAFF